MYSVQIGTLVREYWYNIMQNVQRTDRYAGTRILVQYSCKMICSHKCGKRICHILMRVSFAVPRESIRQYVVCIIDSEGSCCIIQRAMKLHEFDACYYSMHGKWCINNTVYKMESSSWFE